MGNRLQAEPSTAAFFIMVGPALVVLEVKLQIRAGLLLSPSVGTELQIWRHNHLWVLACGADALTHAGITVAESWMRSELTTLEGFLKDKQRKPRTSASPFPTPPWRNSDTLCCVSSSLETPRFLGSSTLGIQITDTYQIFKLP